MKEEKLVSALPRRVRVQSVVRSRYAPGERPTSWDERVPGIETVVTDEGETLNLYSNGGQSSPSAGWELLLTEPYSKKSPEESNIEIAHLWTLYGISRAAEESESAETVS